jgi:uncharacterized protein (DUF1778 family)
MARKRRAEALTRPWLPVRLSPVERERIERAARVNRQNISEFTRDALSTAVQDCIEVDRSDRRRSS